MICYFQYWMFLFNFGTCHQSGLYFKIRSLKFSCNHYVNWILFYLTIKFFSWKHNVVIELIFVLHISFNKCSFYRSCYSKSCCEIEWDWNRLYSPAICVLWLWSSQNVSLFFYLDLFIGPKHLTLVKSWMWFHGLKFFETWEAFLAFILYLLKKINGLKNKQSTSSNIGQYRDCSWKFYKINNIYQY